MVNKILKSMTAVLLGLAIIALLCGLTYSYNRLQRKTGFVGEQQINDWRLRLGPEGQEPEGAIFVYEFVNGFDSCYLAAERSRSGMWMHSFSCK